MRGGRTRVSLSTSLDDAILMMLDPAFIATELDLSVSGVARHLGRSAFDVVATPRGGIGTYPLWPGADSYRLLVDAERGVLLRASPLLEGEVFAGRDFGEIAFDDDIPDEMFVFHPPSNARLRVGPPPPPHPASHRGPQRGGVATRRYLHERLEEARRIRGQPPEPQ